MGHNVYLHLTAVQEANRRFDAGEHPAMMRSTGPGGEYFEDLVEQIFAETDKQKALDLIDSYSTYWTEIIGTRGFKGKKAINGNAMFDQLFEVDGGPDDAIDPETEFDETVLDQLEEEVK